MGADRAIRDRSAVLVITLALGGMAAGCVHVDGATREPVQPAAQRSAVELARGPVGPEVELTAPPPPALELARVEYALEALDRLGGEWPWMTMAGTCVLLLSPQAQWTLNCPKPASGKFRALEGEIFRGFPVYATAETAVEVPDTPLAQGARPLHSIDFLRKLVATAVVPYPERQVKLDEPWIVASAMESLLGANPAFGPETSTEEWLSVFVHEFFHTRQMIDPNFTADLNEIYAGKANPGRLSKLYEEDAVYRAMVQREYDLLASAARASEMSRRQAKRVLRQWLAAYAAREAYLDRNAEGPHLKRLDVVFTYVEGVARYVETRFLVQKSQHPDLSLGQDTRFSRFLAFEGQGYAGMLNKGLGATYYYSIGMHLGLLLDRIDPTWKARVHAEPGFILAVAKKLAAPGQASSTIRRDRGVGADVTRLRWASRAF